MQLASVFPAAQEVGYVRIAETMDNCIANPAQYHTLIQAAHPLLRARFVHVTEADIKKIATEGKNSVLRGVTKVVKKYAEFNSITTWAMDKFVTESHYLAAMDQWLEKHPGDYQGASRYSLFSVISKQPMTPEVTRPSFTKVVLGKAGSMFNSQKIQNGNILLKSYGAYKNGKISGEEMASRFVNVVILPTLMVGAVISAFTPVAKKAKTTAEKALLYSKIAISQLPGVNNLVGAFEYNEGEVSVPALANVSYGNKAILKSLSSKTNLEKFAKMIEATFAYGGVSLQTPKNLAAFAKSVIDGDPLYKRLIMTDYQSGEMSIEAEMKMLKKEMMKGIVSPKEIQSELLRDVWKDILK